MSVYFDEKDLSSIGGNTVGVTCTVVDYPENVVVGIDQNELGLLVGLTIFMVGEVIAQKLGAMGHTEGLKTVTRPPMS